MKRLRRITLNTLTALSLLLCVASTGLWTRSSSHADYFWFTLPFGSDGHRPKFFLFHQAGIFRIARWKEPTDKYLREYTKGFQWELPYFDPPRHRPAYGFDVNGLTLPYWLVAAAFAVLPSLGLGRRLISLRIRQPGLCPVCNYDLRATPTRCPECGTTTH